jgi:hypothetical protein
VAGPRSASATRPFTIQLEDGTRRSFDSLLFANIAEMAKYATLSETGPPERSTPWSVRSLSLEPLSLGNKTWEHEPMTDPTPPDLSQQNLGYQRAAEFLVHYIRKDTTAGNALLNKFGNSKDELERFIFALAEYAIAGVPGGRDQALRWAQELVERSQTADQIR